MKTVFVTICMDIMRRNIIESDFWREFIDNNDVKVVFIVEVGKGGYYREHFGRDNIDVWELDFKMVTFWQRVHFYFMRFAVNTESMRFYTNRAREDKDITAFDALVKKTIGTLFGGANWYKRLLRSTFAFTRSSDPIMRLYDKHKPDLVMSLSLTNHFFDGIIIHEAKRRGISVVGMPRSWDNLTSHGLASELPEKIILQNEFLKEVAYKHQAISRRMPIDVIGLPHYDLYHSPDKYLEDRTTFFERVGLDPNKKLILYPGSDINLTEHTIPPLFEKFIEEGEIKDLVQVVYRPHPSSPVDLEKIGKMKHVILDDVFEKRRIGKLSPMSFDTTNFINYLYHSDIVINSGSTLSIDAAVFGKPVICINFEDESAKVSYWHSVNRMYDSWTHYIRLVKTGGVRLVNSPDELVTEINAYLEDPKRDEEGRKEILRLFAEPLDGQAGKRLAHIMTEELAKV